MISKIGMAVLTITAIVAVTTATAAGSGASVGTREIIWLPNPKARLSSDYSYFTDNSATNTYTREQARQFCSNWGGELAKVSDLAKFNFLLISLPRVGRFWVDGIDKNDIQNFQLDQTCSDGSFNDNLNTRGFALGGLQCLSMVKGANVTLSILQPVDCTTRISLLCGYPNAGCGQPTTTFRSTTT